MREGSRQANQKWRYIHHQVDNHLATADRAGINKRKLANWECPNRVGLREGARGEGKGGEEGGKVTHLGLLRKIFNCLLDDSTAECLKSQAHNVPFQQVAQSLHLVTVAKIKELLYHVVAKHVAHQLNDVWLELGENLGLLFISCHLQVLLNEPKSMLGRKRYTNSFNNYPSPFQIWL